MADKILKCAVYTRKSTEHGLELEFNSLDAQREACEAYIKSQAAEGWKLVPGRYEDGAFSGGNLDRPALQQLLKDIDAGLVDVIVVYKIDRLTRSLADFAKLVEIFDAKKISFVAITQQFNTTTSMGRLTLNVLLSFAQFERELSSERVRDKVAASRKKGKWTGGNVPLGYDSVDKKLVINEVEAKDVRTIFAQYLELKSFQKLVDDLDKRKIVSKRRHTKGGDCGSKPFTYGPLAYVLKNRTYIGETGHKGAWFPGEHEAIIDEDTFNRAQDLLAKNATVSTHIRRDNARLLTGILFDDRGNRMSPSFTVKSGVRYYSYVSTAILRGRKEKAGSVPRISATTIESQVLSELKKSATLESEESTCTDIVAKSVDYIERVTVSAARITIRIKWGADGLPYSIELPREIKKDRPTYSEMQNSDLARNPDPALVKIIVRGNAWLNQLSNGNFRSIEALAHHVGRNPRLVRNAIKAAFLPPNVTSGILSGQIQNTKAIQQVVRRASLVWGLAA